MLLDNLRVVAARNADAVGDAQHVPIDGQAWNAERVTENYVRGLPADARQRRQLVHRGWNRAAMLRDNGAGHADERA